MIFRLRMLLIALALLPLVATGCRRSSPVTYRITVQWPGAAAAEIDHRVAASLMSAMNGMPNLTNMESHSYSGRAELYVVLASDDSVLLDDRLSAALPGLPKDCDLPQLAKLSRDQAIPIPPRGEEEEVSVVAKDEETLQRVGLTAAEVRGAIARTVASARDTKDANSLKTLPVDFGERSLILDDIAEIRVEMVPKCIIRDLAGPRAP